MPVQVLEFIPSGMSKNNKRTPPKVKLSNGIEAVIGRAVNFDDVQKGCWGEPNISSVPNGSYTNHTLESWQQTMPAGEATQPMPSYEQKDAAKTDQSVWDAKDRMIALEAAQKPAAEMVKAMLAANVIVDEADVARSYEALTIQGYELSLLARAGRLATKANPFASE